MKTGVVVVVVPDGSVSLLVLCLPRSNGVGHGRPTTFSDESLFTSWDSLLRLSESKLRLEGRLDELRRSPLLVPVAVPVGSVKDRVDDTPGVRNVVVRVAVPTTVVPIRVTVADTGAKAGDTGDEVGSVNLDALVKFALALL
eukprot:Hpha_TRINITY_DN15923_c0_g2::TRINITY_DN15923_c0_g2_i7::g.74285::m.74285